MILTPLQVPNVNSVDDAAPADAAESAPTTAAVATRSPSQDVRAATTQPAGS